jgi:curved DNA-binding protein CbpA
MALRAGAHSLRSAVNYYATLGVREDASFREIEAAYWLLAKSPDGRERIKLLNEAYETLGNALRREQYDALRRAAAPGLEEPWSPPQRHRTIFRLRGFAR